MHYFAALFILPFLSTSAIDMILFEDNDCDTPEDPAMTCVDYNYNQCCGSFTTSDPVSGVLFGAAAVNLGSTAAENTPTLRAYNQGGDPVSICGLIRASWPLEADAENPGTFPCGAAAAPNSFNGYIVVSIVTSKEDEHLGARTGEAIEPNAIGVLENGTIYAIRRDSELGSLYKELAPKMTVNEKRSFIIMYTEIEKRKGTKVFRA
jgi:hypothetical protein